MARLVRAIHSAARRVPKIKDPDWAVPWIPQTSRGMTPVQMEAEPQPCSRRA